MIMSPARRSRFRRSPAGKRILLSDRDIEILRWLCRYRYLRATHLTALLQPKSEKRFIERLGDLFHETGLIDRPAAQWRRFDARYQPIIYELSSKGLRYLEAHDELPFKAVTFAKGHGGQTPHFDHAMMIVDELVAVELETRRKRGMRFVPVKEILARLPETDGRAPKHPLAVPVTIKPTSHLPVLKSPTKTHVVPDGLYGIGHQQADGEWLYRFYALECERTNPRSRSTAKLSSLALKLAAYEELIRSQAFKAAWGIPNLELRVVR